MFKAPDKTSKLSMLPNLYLHAIFALLNIPESDKWPRPTFHYPMQ